MSEYDPYLAISLFGHLFPGIAKNAFAGLTIFKIFWSFLARGLRLIAVNMHYAKFALWTPKLQTLAKTLAQCYEANLWLSVFSIWIRSPNSNALCFGVIRFSLATTQICDIDPFIKISTLKRNHK